MRSFTGPAGFPITVHELTPATGDAAGTPTLLVHATGFHGRVWHPVAAHLSGFDCWAPDLRGHGDSPVASGHDFAWDGFADDVLAVLDQLGLDSPLGVGHSKGGAALLLAEQRRPGTFRGLWCWEPVVFPPAPDGSAGSPDSPLTAGARNRRQRFDSYEAAVANFAAKPPMQSFAPEAVAAYVHGGFAADDSGVRLKCRPEDEARVYQMGGRHGAWDLLPKVRCPVLVARGAVGPGHSPAGFVADIAGRLPAGRLEVHEDLGHFGPMEDPGRIADSIRAFAASL